MSKILLALSALTLIPLVGGEVASRSLKSRHLEQKKAILLDGFILVVLALVVIGAPEGKVLLGAVSILILIAVFLEKSHLMRVYQVKPTLPLPYARYEETPQYSPTAGEWVLALGSVGVCVFSSTLIINLRTLILG